MTRNEVAALLAVCAAAFPHVRVTKETATIYAEMLADLDAEPAMRAVRRLIASSQYFPSIAAIREATTDLVVKLPPTAARAWQEVAAAVRDLGHYANPTWSHPAIGVAVATLGWRDICMGESSSVTRAHFWRVYEAAAKEAHADAVLPSTMRSLPK